MNSQYLIVSEQIKNDADNEKEILDACDNMSHQFVKDMTWVKYVILFFFFTR